MHKQYQINQMEFSIVAKRTIFCVFSHIRMTNHSLDGFRFFFLFFVLFAWRCNMKLTDDFLGGQRQINAGYPKLFV